MSTTPYVHPDRCEEPQPFTVYVSAHPYYGYPVLSTTPSRGARVYLNGNVEVWNYRGNQYFLLLRSPRRSTVLGDLVLLDDGSLGVYLNGVFKGMGNKADVVLGLKALLQEAYGRINEVH